LASFAGAKKSDFQWGAFNALVCRSLVSAGEAIRCAFAEKALNGDIN